jgi:hypothetical protein
MYLWIQSKATIDGVGSGYWGKSFTIPLPVVHVHGILTDLSEDRIPHGLFNYLSYFQPYTEDDSEVTTKIYPTLVSVKYPSLYQSTSRSGQVLAAFIRNQVIYKTYADQVNVVAHSLGGLVARDTIWNDSSTDHPMHSVIKKLILVGSPCEGVVFAPVALDNWGLIKVVAFEGKPYSPFFAAAWQAGSSTTRELAPTYPWYSTWPWQTDRSIPSYKNYFLENLNRLGLHPEVSYYTVIASQYHGSDGTLAYVWGRFSWLTIMRSIIGIGGGVEGDGLVPKFSQLGEHTGWPAGVGPGKISRYRADGSLRDAGDVYHTKYFNQQSVNSDIYNILWP